MSHIINKSPVNKSESGLPALHSIFDSIREWLCRVHCLHWRSCRLVVVVIVVKVKADIALPGNPIAELLAIWDHTSVTCHPTQVNALRQTPAMQAGTRFTYPGGMEGWVDLVDLIAPHPGVEPATFWSRVRRPTTAPPRQVLVLSFDTVGQEGGLYCFESCVVRVVWWKSLVVTTRRQWLLELLLMMPESLKSQSWRFACHPSFVAVVVWCEWLRRVQNFNYSNTVSGSILENFVYLRQKTIRESKFKTGRLNKISVLSLKAGHVCCQCALCNNDTADLLCAVRPHEMYLARVRGGWGRWFKKNFTGDCHEVVILVSGNKQVPMNHVHWITGAKRTEQQVMLMLEKNIANKFGGVWASANDAK